MTKGEKTALLKQARAVRAEFPEFDFEFVKNLVRVANLPEPIREYLDEYRTDHRADSRIAHVRMWGAR